MSRVAAILDRHFHGSTLELHVGGIPISTIVAEHGTPLFVYDRQILERQWQLLRGTLPDEFVIYYSVKANPTQAILRAFRALGCGLEIASGGEFHQALAAGCPAEDILFAGPGKTEEELELVLSEGIGEVHVESLLEAQRIAAICGRLGRRAGVAVRVNPGGTGTEGGALRMGGTSAPFGIDEEQLDPVVDEILASDHIDLRGIHLFLGTQILDHNALITQYRRGLDIARHVAHRLGGPLKTVDFGGGLGIPYFPKDTALDMAALGVELRAMMSEIRGEPFFQGTTFLLEPGRFLVGESGVYVARVHDVKESRGTRYAITDGGMHHHLAASGNLGQVIRRNFPVALVNRLDELPEETVNVVGPLCTPLDVLARKITLPKVRVGDLVGVFQSGAYGRTASPLGFLSHRTPPEVLVDGGLARLIRARGTFEDLVLPRKGDDPGMSS